MKPLCFVLCSIVLSQTASAREPDRVIDVWPDLAPGESTKNTGETLPRRPNENPPATRVARITKPTLHIYNPPEGKANGTAVVILPGGGYNYVVTDKEGSEAAEWLNGLGITAFVLHYRTKPKEGWGDDPAWLRPVQDGQRAISYIRQDAKKLGVSSDRIGVIGFSAGGQAAAMIATRFEKRDYKAADKTDDVSCRPDFAVLVYPWRIADEKAGGLIKEVTVTKDTPPTLLIHAHNDSATSLSSIYFYTAMKKLRLPCELHIYETGGHGYGMRPVKGSQIHTWPNRATDWLKQRKLAGAE